MIFHSDKRGGFVMIDRKALEDPKISLKSKGLLAYLLSKPPDWRPQIADIVKHCTDGAAAVKSALQELKAAGYAALVKTNGSNGRIDGSRWSIFETPTTTENAVFRLSENRSLSNTKESTKKVLGSSRKFEDFKGRPKEVCGIKVTLETLRPDFETHIKEIIKRPQDAIYRSQWEERFLQAPWRTCCSMEFAVEDMITAQVSNSEPLKNPSGKANWYFLHYDIETGRIKDARRNPTNKANSRPVREAERA